MMILKHDEVQKTNTIHKFLKSKNVKELEELKIYKCGHCNGTGIPKNENFMIWHSYVRKYMWDTVNFCKNCKGVGYVYLGNPDVSNLGDYDCLSGYNIDGVNFVCKSCNGMGCGKCNHTGIVDWVSHIMGGES
jgi:hypothetical protein